MIQGYLPKTNILYANHYELEIIRIFYMFAPENKIVTEMVQPTDAAWIEKLLTPLGKKFLTFGTGQAAVQKDIPLSYLLMAFTDINDEKTEVLIQQKKDWLLDLLRRGWITGKLSNGKISEGDTYNLMGKYIIRNALGTLPEYEDIAKYEIYVSSEDERCYCNI